jgi:hypothetical protein
VGKEEGNTKHRLMYKHAMPPQMAKSNQQALVA